MLNKEEFDQWCWRLGLSDQASVITHIHTSLLVRRIRSSAGNVSGAYPSLKIGFAIQFESHRMEEDLVRLEKEKPFPFFYQKRDDGSWYCPPGKAYAAQTGLIYRLFSSAEIDWIYIENLRFLGDYL